MFIKDEIYKHIVDSVPVITVDVVLLNPERTNILLFKRVNKPLRHTFYTPGGRVNKNEYLIDAIIRKTKEELGITMKQEQIQYCGVIEEFFKDSHFEEITTGTHNINIFYKYIIDDISTIEIDNQHTAFEWFDVNDPNLNNYIKHKIKISLSSN